MIRSRAGGPARVCRVVKRLGVPIDGKVPIQAAEYYGIERIAFLKCEIEGSEFFMIEPRSRILDITDRLAIEVHDFGGDVKAFLNGLKERGFIDVSVDWYGAECIARAARPVALSLAA